MYACIDMHTYTYIYIYIYISRGVTYTGYHLQVPRLK